MLVTAAVLESWKLALWVLLAIPTAWIGTAIGFLVTGESSPRAPSWAPC